VYTSIAHNNRWTGLWRSV